MINCAIKNTDEKLALTADKSLYIKILYNYKQINYLKRPKFNMKQTLFSTVAATGVEPATFTLWGCYATTYTSLRCLWKNLHILTDLEEQSKMNLINHYI